LPVMQAAPFAQARWCHPNDTALSSEMQQRIHICPHFDTTGTERGGSWNGL
jgi:hypothetical protein